MLKKLLLLGALASLATLTGCTGYTTPVNPDDATPVNAVNLGTPISSDDVKLMFVRDSGMYGSAARIVCSINGVPAVSLMPKQKTTLYLPPDQYSITCGSNHAFPNSVFLRGEAKENLHIRIGFVGQAILLYQAGKNGVLYSMDFNTKPIKP